MTPEEILNGNKLIAKFMGLKIITDEISWFDTNYKSLGNYDSSWDWLMPVIDKIETLNYAVTITQNICTIKACIMGDRTTISHQTGNYTTPDTKLYNTYIAAIEFINWYNKQIKENESSIN